MKMSGDALSLANLGGNALISEVVLYTSLCSWDNNMHNYSILIKGGVLISGVLLCTCVAGILHNVQSKRGILISGVPI